MFFILFNHTTVFPTMQIKPIKLIMQMPKKVLRHFLSLVALRVVYRTSKSHWLVAKPKKFKIIYSPRVRIKLLHRHLLKFRSTYIFIDRQRYFTFMGYFTFSLRNRAPSYNFILFNITWQRVSNCSRNLSPFVFQVEFIRFYCKSFW